MYYFIILIGIFFFIAQFFSEKKFEIGIFVPSTIISFLSFTIFCITVILYLNYDYYYNFLSRETNSNFIKILLINLILIISGIIFIFSSKKQKKWIQIIFFLILFFNILNSYAFLVDRDIYPPTNTGQNNAPRQDSPENSRKIKIIIMDGLSLDFILSSGRHGYSPILINKNSQKMTKITWTVHSQMIGQCLIPIYPERLTRWTSCRQIASS